MKKGDKIWAIDPCEMNDDGRRTLTVGHPYVICDTSPYSFWITDDEGETHSFDKKDFAKFFSTESSTDPRKQDFIEKASIAAMQGILASGIYAGENSKYVAHDQEINSRCGDAVLWAESLWNQLNQKP